jgi:hypothetical protein
MIETISNPPLTLIPFDAAALRRRLEEQHAALPESTLLKTLTGDTLPGMSDELFVMHFSLYHALYRLKESAGRDGLYLHMDPMRIRLARVPGDGACRHYEAEPGRFCNGPAGASAYCSIHAPLYPEVPINLSYDCVREFYLNAENLRFGRSDLLKKLMNGVFVYAFKKGEIESALALFGLSRPSRNLVRTRYRELARKYHPDAGHGDESMMKRLNSAYGVLSEVFVL